MILAAAQLVSIAGDVRRNVERHLVFARLAAERGVRLLVFPELSLIGYELALGRSHVLRADAAELAPLRDFAAGSGVTMVAGAPIAGEGDVLHIGAFVFRGDGSVATYTKEHVHESEQHVFTSGPGGAMVRAGGARVALAICADATFPSHAAKAAAGGADVYAVGVMIDDAGYARKTALLHRYAEEHRMAVVMANYSGVTGGETSAGKSAIWSDGGRVVAASSGTEEALVVAGKEHGEWRGLVVPVLDERVLKAQAE